MSKPNEDLQQITKAQKKLLDEHMKAYNRNIKSIGKRAGEDRARYNIPCTEIAAVAGMSENATRDFLNGKTVPHLVVVSAICGAVRVLKPQYALKTVTKTAKKS